MRFEFCGNVDCPEWVLSEVVQLNKISAIKLKLVLQQILRKILGQAYDQDKLIKICKDQKLSSDDTRCLLALIEFILSQAGKHLISEQSFSKDLLQMGIAIENSNAIVKLYQENQENLVKSLRQQTLRVSQINSMSYKVNHIFATSASGIGQSQTTGQLEPLTSVVTLGIDMTEFPNEADKKKTFVKFSAPKDKFLQFSRDMKEALALLENAQTLE